MEIRLAYCLSVMRDNFRASCSAPPFRTISIVLSLASSSVPTGTPTTFTPPSAMWTPTP